MTNTAVRTRDLTVVGTSIVRHDAVEKVQGKATYAADARHPQMLHAMLKRSEHAHARLMRIDTDAAKRSPGVVDVLTASDVPCNVIRASLDDQDEEGGASGPVSYVLADGVVRYHGEPVALVVAESEDVCLAATDLIDISYELLPVVDDPCHALDGDAPALHDGGNLLASWSLEKGNVEPALATAAAVVSAEYTTQFVDHAYLEPEAGTAWLDAEGVIVLQASSQVLERAEELAAILSVQVDRIRMITPYIGGGFGGKEDMTVEPYLAVAVQRTGLPVRMIWSRQESLLARSKRHPIRMRHRTGADDRGNLVAQDIEMLIDGGAYAQLSIPVMQWATACAAGPYWCPNVRVSSRVVYTNHTPCSAMRGFGAMQVVLGYEGQMDELAAALEIDRVEIRRRNFVTQGQELPAGHQLKTTVALPELADAVTQSLGLRPQPTGPERRIGRGFACNMQPYGFSSWTKDWATASVAFELDGSVRIRTGVVDVGGGQASSLIQIASEVLGIPPGRVTVQIGDSALTPRAGRTSSTRQLYMSGNAVLAAASKLRQAVAAVAAEAFEADHDHVQITDAGATERGSRSHRIPLPELLTRCVEQGVSLAALETFHAPEGMPWRADPRWRGRVAPDFTFGFHGVDLEVDTQTGYVHILRYIAAHDVGRAINPQSVRGQIEGAVVMGIGHALFERVVYEQARNLVNTFSQYLTPTALEAPEVDSILLEGGDGVGPFGARGIGEPPIGPPAAAIASALADALGSPVRSTPVLPETIVEAAKLQSGRPARPASQPDLQQWRSLR